MLRTGTPSCIGSRRRRRLQADRAALSAWSPCSAGVRRPTQRSNRERGAAWELTEKKPAGSDGLHALQLLVDLPKRFSNTRPALKTFIRRVLKGSERRGPRTRTPERHDSRGVVAKNAAKSQTRLTPERRAELVADYEAGMPVRMIAAKYAVHRGTVPTLVTKDGARLRTSGLSLTGRAHAASLYAEGLTLREVAERLGVDEKTVRNAVVEERGLIRPRGRRPHEARRDSSA